MEVQGVSRYAHRFNKGGRRVPGRTVLRYSFAFKQKVVSEIESGKLTASSARRLYDIKGADTIGRWLKQFGKLHLLNQVVRIEMKDEKDKIKELEREKRKLESALAQEHLRNICLESLIECVEEHYKIDIKKNFGEKVSKKQFSGSKNKQ
jgi:transposase-like protein